MTPIELNPIQSIGDLLETINQFKSAVRERSEHFNDVIFCYRGEEDYDWPIQPSIFRNDLYIHESEIIQEVLRQHPSDFPSKISGADYFNALVKMQHYGVPTRLLDFTANPLFALFFSCQRSSNEHSKNGKFILVAGVPQHGYDFSVSIISYFAFYGLLVPHYKHTELYDEIICNLYNKLEQNKFSLDLLGFKKEFEHQILVESIKENCIVLPLMNNERIKRQSGMFMIFGSGVDCERPLISSSSLVATKFEKKSHLFTECTDNNIFYSIVTVDKDFKKGILNGLESLGINHSSIYPELSATASYLKTKYESIESHKRFLEVIQTTGEPL